MDRRKIRDLSFPGSRRDLRRRPYSPPPRDGPSRGRGKKPPPADTSFDEDLTNPPPNIDSDDS